MEDEASILLDGKALGNLRVVDLKLELEKRGLSKSGSKKDLVKRLKQQLEFEKLCGERKTTGDCDLKLELDADTEQNEFVQQYLAQQQKIYAEQKEVKRLIELEEIQRSGDERGSDSPRADDASDQETHPEESSDNESEEKTPVAPEVCERGRRGINKASREAATNKRTETDSVTKKISKGSELGAGSHEERVTSDFVSVKTAKNLETKHERSRVEPNEDEEVSSDGKGRKKKRRIEEKEVRPVAIEADSTKKESRLEKINKEDASSESDEDKSCVKESKVQIIKDKVIGGGESGNVKARIETVDESLKESRDENITDKSLNKPKVTNIDENLHKPRVDYVEDKNLKKPVDNTENESLKKPVDNTKNESLNKLRVDNIKNESLDKPKVDIIEDESLNKPKVDIIEDESLNKPRGDNIEDENSNKSRNENIEVKNVQISSIENTEDQNVKVGKIENIEPENMKVSQVENIEDENMKASKVENIEDETLKVSNIENIGDEKMKVSRVETVQKIETDIKTVERIDDENQGSVSSCSVPLVHHDVKIQKLSERKSIEETSDILKNHPSSVDFSETADSPKRDQSLNMEPATEISSVPYSVSDIQLPESPGSIKKPLSKSAPEEVSTDQPVIESKSHPITTTEGESRTNGNDSNSSSESPVPDKQTSDPETASSNLNGESPRKGESVTEVVNSSDGTEKQEADESAKLPTSEACKKKVTSENPKESKYSEGSEEGEMRSDSESATEESSDSHERRRGRRKSRKVKRKGNQRRKSGTSDSSRSRSSDRKRSKKDTESSAKSDSRSISESADSVREGAVSSHASAPTKQRLKLKRDNVVVSDSLLTVKKNSTINQVSDERKHSDVVTQPVDSESSKTEPVEVQPVPKYVSTRKIRLSSRKVSEKSEDEPKGKKGKWGNFSSSQKTSPAVSISTDSLKNWFPDFKLLRNPETVSEVVFDDTPLPIKEESHKDPLPERMDESNDFPLNAAAVKDETKVTESAADQPENGGEASNILFVQNLVRPFTLLQLKELLKETGNIMEEKFWIDKIKSKCFVTYETVEEAVKTRNALNGSRWPSSNPKILSVEFATENDLQFHQSGSEPPKPAPLPPPLVERTEDRTTHLAPDLRKKEREPERRRERTKLPVREWDKNKLTQESPTRERASKSAERFKATDKREKKDAKRRLNEDTPAKLLDDLFQKTKSSPCIYWLPLTEEQVVEREESIRLRRVEREKRNQLREQEDTEHKNKSAQSRNRTREMETRRSSTRSRSPVTRRR